MESIESAAGRNRRPLIITLVVTLIFMVVEVIGGILTNSLLLVADAAHMATDAAGLALALFAMWMAGKPSTPQKTYGYYRAEILAATVNSVVLLGLGCFILWEAYCRWFEPEKIDAGPMLAIAALGLGVNLFGVWNLHGGAEESLNIKGAFLEVMTDALGSVATIVAAAVIWYEPSWQRIDSLLSAALGLFILPRTFALLSQSVHVLLEGTPAHINMQEVEALVRATDGVADVHDLHVWTITSGIDAVSMHVVLKNDTPAEQAFAVVDYLSAELKNQFKLAHTTIQVECRDLRSREMAI